jgi:hypothetical protein
METTIQLTPEDLDRLLDEAVSDLKDLGRRLEVDEVNKESIIYALIHTHSLNLGFWIRGHVGPVGVDDLTVADGTVTIELSTWAGYNVSECPDEVVDIYGTRGATVTIPVLREGMDAVTRLTPEDLDDLLDEQVAAFPTIIEVEDVTSEAQVASEVFQYGDLGYISNNHVGPVGVDDLTVADGTVTIELSTWAEYPSVFLDDRPHDIFGTRGAIVTIPVVQR